MPLTESTFRKAVASDALVWRQHALVRMMERGISRSQVKSCISTGDIIEQYADDRPFPSVLISGEVNEGRLHVVAAFDVANELCYIITVYRPDSLHFETDSQTRKRRHEK